MGSKNSFASAMASVDIKVAGLGEDGEFNNVIFVYEPAQLNRYIRKPVFTAWSFFEIAAIIILVTGCLVLVYTLWHEGINKFIGYQSNAGLDLVEEDSSHKVDEHS